MDKSNSLVVQFDDLIGCYNVLLNSSLEKQFLHFITNQEEYHKKYIDAINECKRLKASLDAANKDISMIDSKLSAARRLLDAERKSKRKVEEERDGIIEQLENVKRALFKDGTTKLPDETRDRLSLLCRDIHTDRLNTITEFDSTSASNLSDISFSRSEDDLDELTRRSRTFRKHRPSFTEEPVADKRIKKRKQEIHIESSNRDQLVATTTVTVPHEGPVSAKSVIETFPPLDPSKIDQAGYIIPKMEPLYPSLYNTPRNAPSAPTEESAQSVKAHKTPYTFESALDRINARTHSFIPKNVYMPEICVPCDKKILFGKRAFKCTQCNAFSHIECKDKVPLPCVPLGTPSKGGIVGYLHDYAPLIPPMIPALVIHCINEIEHRGMSEVGLYRIPGADKEVRALKEKFLRGKGAPDLSTYDIHSVCGCLKDFLRSLQESLISKDVYSNFVQAVTEENSGNRMIILFKAISYLPQPNRDTLAFIILHLKRVANSTRCKMPLENLAKIFALTIVGGPLTIDADALTSTHLAILIVEELLKLSTDYWSSFIVEQSDLLRTPVCIRHTPSTECIMKKTPRKLLKTPRK